MGIFSKKHKLKQLDTVLFLFLSWLGFADNYIFFKLNDSHLNVSFKSTANAIGFYLLSVERVAYK